MKRKIIVGILIIFFIFSMAVSFYNVKAYSGEIDPENYIYLPSIIYISGGEGKGTISLSSQATGYSISYQKVDITQSTYNNIQNKSKEASKYSEESEKTLEEKAENVTALLEEYQKLNSSGTAEQEAITEAYNKYNEARQDYNDYVDTVKANIDKLEKEYYALMPDYTSNWKSTTNSSNNVQLDFTSYTPGTVYFVLWAKITNGTNTYYDVSLYTSNITSNPSSEEEPDDTDGDWTDFTKAKIELKRDGVAGAMVQISGVTPKENSKYYLVITSSNSKPNVTSEDSITLEYNSDNKILKTSDRYEIARYVELNQELYASIIEVQNYEDEKIVIYGKKLERYAEPKYSDAFNLTHMTDGSDQIITTFTSSGVETRKMQIKVGKITDKSILQKIKNQDSSGFADLLTFAKSNNGIYNETHTTDEDSTLIEYNANSYTQRPALDVKGLEDGEYYFLYVKVDDENGKYIAQEAVTLSQASVYPDAWYLFFYGSSDFKWADFGDVSLNTGKNDVVDNTVAPGKIPQTGIHIALITVIVALIGAGTFSYIQYRKNNF